MSPDNISPLLKKHEAADLLQIDPGTLDDWVRAGVVHPIRTPGGYPRYREVELLGLISFDPRSERLLMASEAADLLNSSPKKLRRLVKKGLLSVIRVGRGPYRYRESEIRALVQKPAPSPSDSAKI